MPSDDRLSSSLQESLLAALAWHHKEASLIRSLVTPELFEGEYKDIVDRVLDYRDRFNAAPGDGHIDDLFDHILSDPEHKKFHLYQRLLVGIRELSQHLNIEYLNSRLREFVRRQRYKLAIQEAAECYQTGGDSVADDVERIILNTVRQQTEVMDTGTFFSDIDRVFSFLDKDEIDSFPTGIPELDLYGACPKRKEFLLFEAPKGKGKSWWEIFIAKMNVISTRCNICHITLENSEDVTKKRYLQTFFGMARRNEWIIKTNIEKNEYGDIVNLRTDRLKPRYTLEDGYAVKNILAPKILKFPGMRNLVIKEFPTGSLTITRLESYLDYLEHSTGFVPDLLLIDYPDLMQIDQKDIRHSLGRIFVELRRIAGQRNCAVVAPTQANREGIRSSKVRSDHVSEDISKIFTADIVITYSQTDVEHKFGLCRLFVANSRNDRDRFTVLVSQSYAMGQFALSSAMMGSKYDDMLTTLNGKPLPAEEEYDQAAED